MALDPGAKRCGWAAMYSGGAMPEYISSGIISVDRGNLSYQDYRIKIVREWAKRTHYLLDAFLPHRLVSETLPVRGFNSMSQALLAGAAVTTAQAIALDRGLDVDQISANTVKARIGGTNKATKVGVRNGVWHFFPELKTRGWTKPQEMDEPDAIAVGLAYFGYTIR